MRAARLLSGPGSTPPAMANFDSTTAFVRALARYLRGEGFPRQGMIPRALATILPLANRLPMTVRQRIYARSGASEGVQPGRLGSVDVESFRRWVVDQYPEHGYPAVVVGAPNGAAVHLAAILGVPWLPQTFLIPVRRSLSPGAATADLEWGREPGRELLAANPDVQLHHMHDPNQDRLTVGELAYFRVKLRRLGPAYEQFVAETLAPGGHVLVLDCDHRWPATRVADRHVFQFGGLGGLEPDEYHHGSERVAAFLDRQGATRTRWNPPEPDGTAPEAEWGFEPALLADVGELADRRGYDLHQVTFDGPRDLSGLVADFYRDQYAERGFDTGRVFVQNFTLLDPWWTLRTGSIPYWLPFNANAAADDLAAYLDHRSDPVDELYLTLFSNGIEAAGQAGIDRWRRILDIARVRGEFVGVDPGAYPGDFGCYVRYHSETPETIPGRQPLLPAVPPEQFVRFVDEQSDHRPVERVKR